MLAEASKAETKQEQEWGWKPTRLPAKDKQQTT